MLDSTEEIPSRKLKWLSPIRALQNRYKGLRLGIKFCVAMARQKTGKLPFQPQETLHWEIYQQSIAVDVTWPRGRPKGTIMMVHGMNAFGARDPRMLSVSKILVKLGFIVIAPTYPSICHHEITAEQTHEIGVTIAKVVTNRRLCPKGRLSIFTASFSGGISVRAAAMSPYSNKISTILSIGIFNSGYAVMQDIIHPNCEDDYAHFIGIRYIYRRASSEDVNFDVALTAAINDAFDYAPDDHVEAFLATLPDNEAKRIGLLIEQFKQREFCIPQDVLARVDYDAMRQSFEFVELLKDVPFKLYAVQAEHDKIMLTHHADKLRDFIKAHRMKHHIAITPILDHANVRVSLGNIFSVIDMVHTFGRFFDKALR